MKTIEEQLDDMLPEDVRRRRRLKRSHTVWVESIAADLRVLERTGMTVEQFARNLNSAVPKPRKQNIM